MPVNQAIGLRPLIREKTAVLSEACGLPRFYRKDMKHQIQDPVPAMGTFKVRHGFGHKLLRRKAKVKGQLDHQGDRLDRK